MADSPRSTSSATRSSPSSTPTPSARPRTSDSRSCGARATTTSPLFEEVDREQEQRELEAAKAWRAKRYDAGLGWITGPEAVRRPRAAQRLRARSTAALEAQVRDARARASSASASAWSRPTILAHATDEVKDALPARRCTAATSSAASCSASRAPAPTSPACRPRPSATATSGSSPARRCGPRAPTTRDIGEIICRTDPDQPKHKGLTGFVVDMQAPGVEVRPLRQMTGGASFNEVFFNERARARRPPPRRRQRRAGPSPSPR